VSSVRSLLASSSDGTTFYGSLLAVVACFFWIVVLGFLIRRVLGRSATSRRGSRTHPTPTRPRRHPKLRETPPDESWRQRPQPGEIWWAEVPFDDGTGSKVRPCLVLRTFKTRVEVLKITSQDQRTRHDHIEIPTRTWDPKADHNSFLDLTDPYRLRDSAFERRAGVIDARIWAKVQRVHPTGFGT
jgi:hypothetical protein